MYYGDINSDNAIDMGDVLLAQRIADFNMRYPRVAGSPRWNLTYLSGYGITVMFAVNNGDGTWSYPVVFDDSPNETFMLTEQQVLDNCGMTVDVLKRADVDGNGAVTAADVGLIQQYILGLITQFPVESIPQGGGTVKGIGRIQGVITNLGSVSVTVRVHLYTKSMFAELGTWNPESDRPQDYNLAFTRSAPFPTWNVNQSYDFSALPPAGDGVIVGDKVSIRGFVERVLPTPVTPIPGGVLAPLEGIVTEGGGINVTWSSGSSSISRAVGGEGDVSVDLQLGYIGQGETNWWPWILAGGAVLLLPKMLKRARRARADS